MSFYTKSVKDLAIADLQELVDSQAQENVRLEFKSETVEMEKLLRKVASFANTSGGRIVMGMAEGPKNTAREVVGIAPQPSFEAQVSAWCAQYLYPPLVPEISPGIPIAGKQTVAYVISVEESELAPHFIEGRRGCYVRTNESSQRFDARLADLAEIQALLNRREQARRRAEDLLRRSHERREKYQSAVATRPQPGGRWVACTIRVAPLFPRRELLPAGSLLEAATKATVGRRGDQLPDLGRGVHSQVETLIFAKTDTPDARFLEVTTFGTSSFTEYSYPENVAKNRMDDDADEPKSSPAIWMFRVLATALLGGKFSCRFLQEAGLRGQVEVTLTLENLDGVVFYGYPGQFDCPVGKGRSFLDSTAEVGFQSYSEDLLTTWPERIVALWRELFFAVGWVEAPENKSARIVDSCRDAALKWLGAGPEFLSLK